MRLTDNGELTGVVAETGGSHHHSQPSTQREGAAALDPTVVATFLKAAAAVDDDDDAVPKPNALSSLSTYRVVIMAMIIMANVLLLFGSTVTIVQSSGALEQRNLNIM